MFRIAPATLGCIQVCVQHRNGRWDVHRSDFPGLVADFLSCADAVDYARCVVARSHLTVLELRDENGVLTLRETFGRGSNGQQVVPLTRAASVRRLADAAASLNAAP